MLTCKSLFGLGYRGERLIEPFTMVVESGAREGAASPGWAQHRRRPSARGETVKLRGHVARPSVGPVEGNLGGHPGQSPGAA